MNIINILNYGEHLIKIEKKEYEQQLKNEYSR